MGGTGVLLSTVHLFPGVQQQLVCVLTQYNITIESKRVCNQTISAT